MESLAGTSLSDPLASVSSADDEQFNPKGIIVTSSVNGGKRKLPSWLSQNNSNKQAKSYKGEFTSESRLETTDYEDRDPGARSKIERTHKEKGQRSQDLFNSPSSKDRVVEQMPRKRHAESKSSKDEKDAKKTEEEISAKRTDNTNMAKGGQSKNFTSMDDGTEGSRTLRMTTVTDGTKEGQSSMDKRTKDGKKDGYTKVNHALSASMNKGKQHDTTGEGTSEVSFRLDTEAMAKVGRSSIEKKKGNSGSGTGLQELVGSPHLDRKKMVRDPRCNDFSKFLDGVTFAISGLVNPQRSAVRDKALQMGAHYRPDWNHDCTLLVCAYASTPKFNQVVEDNGTIVSKEWVLDCHAQKKLLEIDPYLMHPGKPWRRLGHDCKGSVQCEDNNSEMTIASLADVREWVHEDVKSGMVWLQQQETKPDASEVKELVISGIHLCFDDMVGVIKRGESMRSVLETWDFVPRAIQELAGREPSTTHESFLHEAERLQWVYSDELERLRKGTLSKIEKDGDDNDDDTTEILLSGDDDGKVESDTTEILDDESVREAQAAISKMMTC